MSQDQIFEARLLFNQGKNTREIADILSVSEALVYSLLMRRMI